MQIFDHTHLSETLARRAAMALLLAPTFLTASAAFAEGTNPKKERRAALAAAVKEIKDTGKSHSSQLGLWMGIARHG